MSFCYIHINLISFASLYILLYFTSIRNKGCTLHPVCMIVMPGARFKILCTRRVHHFPKYLVFILKCALDFNSGCTHFPPSAHGGCTKLNLNFEHCFLGPCHASNLNGNLDGKHHRFMHLSGYPKSVLEICHLSFISNPSPGCKFGENVH